jgi:hypothetical protein
LILGINGADLAGRFYTAACSRGGMRMKSHPMIELPVSNTGRWVARRKAAVVAAVAGGVFTIQEACRRYHMSEEEFLGWQRAFENGGLPDLRQKRLIRSRGPVLATRPV